MKSLYNPLDVSDDELQNIADSIDNNEIMPVVENITGDENKREDLSFKDSLDDIKKSVLTEASHILAPKNPYSWAPDWYEQNYESKTEWGQRMKMLYRYGIGMAGFFAGGLIAAGAKTIAWLPKVVQGGLGAAAAVTGATRAAKAVQTATLGGKILQGALGGIEAGALADFTMYRPEDNDGYFADMFPENAPLVGLIQSDVNDNVFQGKIKNVIDGMLVGTALGGLTEAAGHVFSSLFTRIRGKYRAKSLTKEDAIALAKDELALDRALDNADLYSKVKSLQNQAAEESGDLDNLIRDNIHPTDRQAAYELSKLLKNGQEPFMKEDGTFCLKVEKWEDAASVTPDELKEQLIVKDNELQEQAIKQNTGAIIHEGDSALDLMNDTVKAAWVNRGWIGDKEVLDRTTASRIVKNYKDKFKLDNNIKVEFVDGLTVNGQKVEGNTQSTKYLGKKSGKIKDITIKIDKDAKNPYAALRSELEHARDIAKGEVPDQTKKHFSRYEGLNEAEAAISYIQKKASGYIKKQPALNLKENITNYEKDGFSYTSEKGSKFDPADKLYLVKEGKRLGNLSYYIDEENCLHIEHVFNETIPIYDIALKHQGKHTKGVADRLIEKAIADNPNVNYIIWDTAEGERPSRLLNGFKKRHPEIAKRIISSKEYEQVAKTPINSYNDAKGGYSNAESDRSINRTGDVAGAGENSLTDNTAGKGNNIQTAEQTSDISGSTLSSNKRTDGRGSASKDGMEQPIGKNQLDVHNGSTAVTSTEDTINQLLKGERTLQTEKDAANLIEAIEPEIEISGRTFEALKKDSKLLADNLIKMEQEGQTGLLNAFYNNDKELFDRLSRKVQAGEYAAKILLDQAQNLPENEASFELKANLYKTIKKIAEYTSNAASGYGRGLNEVKVFNSELNNLFDFQLDNQVTKALVKFADTLITSITEGFNLNFTRGKALDAIKVRKDILNYLVKKDKETFMYLNAQAPNFIQDLNSLIDDYIKQGVSRIDKEVLESRLASLVQKEAINNFYKTVKNTASPKQALNVARTFDFNDAAKNYVVNNLLSSGGSTFRNVVSGIANTYYFPLVKMLGGTLTGDKALAREGMQTLNNLASYYKESFELGIKAFKEGHGLMSNIADVAELDRSYNKWQVPNNLQEFWKQVQNIHSLGARIMGASDEWLSQLNYRAITRAKALEAAEQAAEKMGQRGDKKLIEDLAEGYFNNNFDKNGLPKDLNTYYEVKQQMFQTQLDGKLKDPISGVNVSMREQSNLMKLADSMNKIANHNFLFKAFLPFVRTAANITQTSLEHNPIYNLLSPMQRRAFERGGRERALILAKSAFGFSSAIFGTTLASMGVITGSPPADPKTKKALYAKGWRPYSIHIGNTYISYQGVEPLQHILTIPADIVAVYSQFNDPDSYAGWENTIGEGVKIILESMLDSGTFRQGVAQMSDLLDVEDAEGLKRTVARYAQSYIPMGTGLKAIANTGKTNPTNPKGVWERVFNDYLRQPFGDYRRDVFGNKQDIYNVIGIARTQVVNDEGEPEYEEMEHLAQYGWNPAQLSETIGKNVNQSLKDFKGEDGRSAYDYILEEASTIKINGKTLQQAVRELVTSSEYKNLPLGLNRNQTFKWGNSADTKFNAVNDIFREYYTEAKNQFLDKYSNKTFKAKDGSTISQILELAEAERMQAIFNNYSPSLSEFASFE